MQATGEDLHAAVVALALLLGVIVASDPRREELLQQFNRSLDALDSESEWQGVAARAKAYGQQMLANLAKPGPTN
jgi:hypothetical protein